MEGKLVFTQNAFVPVYTKPKNTSWGNAIIHKTYKDTVFLKLSGIYINFLACKGRNIEGNVLYVNPKSFVLKRLHQLNLTNKIIIIDYLPSEFYPRLAALNVAGILTNSLDYNLFKNIILLSTPIAVFSGFGNILFDKKTLKILKELDDKQAYLSSDYNRLFIACDKPPTNLKSYSFDFADQL